MKEIFGDNKFFVSIFGSYRHGRSPGVPFDGWVGWVGTFYNLHAHARRNFYFKVKIRVHAHTYRKFRKSPPHPPHPPHTASHGERRSRPPKAHPAGRLYESRHDGAEVLGNEITLVSRGHSGQAARTFAMDSLA